MRSMMSQEHHRFVRSEIKPNPLYDTHNVHATLEYSTCTHYYCYRRNCNFCIIIKIHCGKTKKMKKHQHPSAALKHGNTAKDVTEESVLPPVTPCGKTKKMKKHQHPSAALNHGNTAEDVTEESVLPPVSPQRNDAKGKGKAKHQPSSSSVRKPKRKTRIRKKIHHKDDSKQTKTHKKDSKTTITAATAAAIHMHDESSSLNGGVTRRGDDDDNDTVTQPGAVAVPGSSVTYSNRRRTRNEGTAGESNRTVNTTMRSRSGNIINTGNDEDDTAQVVEASLVPDMEDIEAQIEERIHQKADQIRQEIMNHAVVADIVQPGQMNPQDNDNSNNLRPPISKATSTPSRPHPSKLFRTLVCLTTFVTVLVITGIVIAVYFVLKPSDHPSPNTTLGPPSSETSMDPTTTVGGVISSDTIWAVSKSPYQLSSTIQVPEGITLTIEQGVQVFATGIPEYENMFVVHGRLVATGATFDGQGHANFFSAENAPKTAFVEIDSCTVQYGQAFWPATGNSQPASFHLHDSTLTDLRDYSYIWYPVNDVTVERNSFVNSCGFSVGSVDADVYFLQNRFESRHQDCPEYMDAWVTSWNAPTGGATIVKWNSFLNVGAMAVMLEPGYDGAALDARENYWGTGDEQVIASMIWDTADDLTTKGIVPYTPYLTEPNSEVPGALTIPTLPPEPLPPPADPPKTPTTPPVPPSETTVPSTSPPTPSVPTLPPAPLPPPADPPKTPTTPPVPPSETTVGGIINMDTLWVTNLSPYKLSSTIQIPEDVTLTIEAGVQVIAEDIPDYGDMFLVHGTLIAKGVTFSGQGKANFFSAKDAPETAFADIESCVIENGRAFWPATGHSQPASFRLIDSSLTQLVDYSYVWYPKKNVYIEGNSFVNSCGLSVGHTDAQVYIRSNIFHSRHVTCPDYMDTWVSSWNAPSGGATIVTGNSFLNVGKTAVMLEPGHDRSAIDARQNYWGTIDKALIEDVMIYDKRDDLTVTGIIEYEPIRVADPN